MGNFKNVYHVLVPVSSNLFGEYREDSGFIARRSQSFLLRHNVRELLP